MPFLHEKEPISYTTLITKNQKLDSAETQGKVKHYWSKCIYTVIPIPYSAIFIDKILIQSSLERPPLAADGNRCRNPQSDIM